MKPLPVKFHLYAEDESEIDELQRSLYDLVTSLYDEGILLTATKLYGLVRKVGNNPLLKQLLR